ILQVWQIIGLTNQSIRLHQTILTSTDKSCTILTREKAKPFCSFTERLRGVLIIARSSKNCKKITGVLLLTISALDLPTNPNTTTIQHRTTARHLKNLCLKKT